MAKRNTVITTEGKAFIEEAIKDVGPLALSGNNGEMPYSLDSEGNKVDKVWTVEATASDGKTLTLSNLAQSLIDWFEKYGNIYGLDPNILAAQAYIESQFKLWNYTKTNTASGINGFKMLMVYSVILNNFGGGGDTMTTSEIVKITFGLDQALAVTSYEPDKGTLNTQTIAMTNRPILHQNMINNPEIMIKAQARYMRYFSDNCAKLASSALLCYRTSNSHVADTYSKAIDKLRKAHGNSTESNVVKDGLDYVLKVFGVLGDVNNELEGKAFTGGYKTKGLKGYSFGYNVVSGDHHAIFKYNDVDDLAEYPNGDFINKTSSENKGGFDEFEANTAESSAYGITQLDDLSIARDDRYKFIYFPSDQYFQTDDTAKNQIVLHHTVSGDKGSVGGDIKWWRDKGERVATAFIIARDGGIYQLFNTNYWAWHLGLDTSSNKTLNKHSIGIEIDSWGGLVKATDEKWYPTIMVNGDEQSKEPIKGATPVENVTEYNAANDYPVGFRGFYGFETYTTEQLNAVRDLILSLVFQSEMLAPTYKPHGGKFPNINLDYMSDIWNINYIYDDGKFVGTSSPDGGAGISANAMAGKEGVWTHTSYRADKSDCHPQNELIERLMGLEAYRKT